MTAGEPAEDLRSRAAALRVEQVDPAGALAVEAIRRYFTDLDRLVGTDFAAGPLDHHGPFLVVVSDGEPIAAGGLLLLLDDGVGENIGRISGEVKRMWVDAAWRGAGLGSRVLRAIEDLAVDAGAHRMVLDTKRALVAAIAMYERHGYRPIERYNDNPHAELFFEKALPRA